MVGASPRKKTQGARYAQEESRTGPVRERGTGTPKNEKRAFEGGEPLPKNPTRRGDEEGSRASQGEKAKAIEGMMDPRRGFRLLTLREAASSPRSTRCFEIDKPNSDVKNRGLIGEI